MTQSNLNFGQALELLKQGKKVARAGWNGKGMWVSLSGSAIGTCHVHADSFWSKNNADFARSCDQEMAPVLPCVTMKTVRGEIMMGWVPTQTDMLADDWEEAT